MSKKNEEIEKVEEEPKQVPINVVIMQERLKFYEEFKEIPDTLVISEDYIPLLKQAITGVNVLSIPSALEVYLHEFQGMQIIQTERNNVCMVY